LKIFIFLLAVLFGVWLWRRNRLNAFKGNGKAKVDLQEPSAMHACDHCGVHLPESDMTQGRVGRYCSESHRQAAGDQLA
jgi:uncharacterized protein